MKILLCHNYYQRPGGEDIVFADESSLLKAQGHEVIEFTRHNHEIETLGKVEALKKALWNSETEAALSALIESTRPDVMHCSNTFPLISPSAYAAAKRQNVAVVQTLHNYRLLCPKAQFLRNDLVCEKCLGKQVAWPALIHSCYRDSRAATAAVVAMLAFHWKRGTWATGVDRFIALTEFSKHKFIQGGLPAEKISVKPNFVRTDPGAGSGSGNYAVFVGRLSPEKGIQSLLQAWQHLNHDLGLKILGDGPLAQAVADAAARDRRISWLGHQAPEDVFKLIGDAKFLIMPSVWYEAFGLTMIEAYAKGTPVIASRMGAMTELVQPNKTGFLYEPGKACALAETVSAALDQPECLKSMRTAARKAYERLYSASANYKQLLTLYETAIEDSRR